MRYLLALVALVASTVCAVADGYHLQPVSRSNVMVNGVGYQVQAHTHSCACAPQVVYYELSDGRLSLPAGYPLMPGDADIWYQLSRPQQERALAFLSTGSTIRSSLQWD